MKLRKLKNNIFLGVIILLTSLTAVPLVAIILEVFVKGYKQLGLAFFTETSPTTLDAFMALQMGEIIPGGVANGLVGTIIMVLMSTLMAVPMGILIGIYLAENSKSRFAGIVRFTADLLQGVPSIVIGLIAYTWVVKPTGGFSAFAASVALMLMMLPMIIRSCEETLKMLPDSLREAALALGCSKFNATFKVLLPSAFGGVFTGILLAISRSIGETAPLLLTALGSSLVSWNVMEPSSALPLLIWEFYNDPNLMSMIWSCSLLLLIVVLVLNIIAKRVARKWRIY